MKIVQSFWSGNNHDLTNSFGWYSYKHHWISWILSCHQLVKYHDKVELYTDSFGYDILIKKLKLPYTKVHVVLDDLNHYPSELWAIGKIKAFQLQNEPFIHVDGDVFVWESLTEKFKKSNLVTQNLEITTSYYRERWDLIHPQLSYIPSEMLPYHENKSNLACNMGIIGGNNMAFFKEYTQKSFDFVDKNSSINLNIVDGINFNVFFEQVLFYELAKKHNQSIDYFFNEISIDNDYKGLGEFEDVPKKSYLHLIGLYKQNPFVCKNMESYTMRFYPECYTLLTKLINKAENKPIEIEFLTKKVVSDAISNFENNNFQYNDTYYLIKRDLHNVGLVIKLEKFLYSEVNFKIYKLNCFDLIPNESTDSIQLLKIHEYNSSPRNYEVDDIDNIILSVLKRPIEYNCFMTKMYTYLEDEDESTVNEFKKLLHNRLRNYISLKIIRVQK